MTPRTQLMTGPTNRTPLRLQCDERENPGSRTPVADSRNDRADGREKLVGDVGPDFDEGQLGGVNGIFHYFEFPTDFATPSETPENCIEAAGILTISSSASTAT